MTRAFREQVVVWAIRPDQPPAGAETIGPGRPTGAHLGYGLLTGPNGLVLLFPATAAKFTALDPTKPPRVRLQFRPRRAALPIKVIDGFVYPVGPTDEGVQVTTAAVVPIEWQGLQDEEDLTYWKSGLQDEPDVAKKREAQEALATLLRKREPFLPGTPPFPSPAPPAGPDRVPEPIIGVLGRKPWWCLIIPRCPGC